MHVPHVKAVREMAKGDWGREAASEKRAIRGPAEAAAMEAAEAEDDDYGEPVPPPLAPQPDPRVAQLDALIAQLEMQLLERLRYSADPFILNGQPVLPDDERHLRELILDLREQRERIVAVHSPYTITTNYADPDYDEAANDYDPL